MAESKEVVLKFTPDLFQITFQDDPSYVKDGMTAKQYAKNFIDRMKNGDYEIVERTEVDTPLDYLS